MLRAIILALVLFVAFSAIIPIATEYAEAGAKKELLRKAKKKNRAKVNRKYFTSNYIKRKKRLRKFRKSNRTTTARNDGKSFAKSRKSRRYNAGKKSRVRKTSTGKRYTKKRRARSSGKYTNAKYRKAKYRKATHRKTRKKSRVRKYSAEWMRSYNAVKSSQQKIVKRKRNMRLKRIRLEKQNQSIRISTKNNYLSPVTIFQNPAQSFVSENDSARQTEPIQLNQLQTIDSNGEVSLDVVGNSVGETSLKGRNKTVGGVSTTTLRRTIIDRMIQENGWVENDYQKEIGGKKVYVVVAKSEDKNNRIQSRTFYFTESNGQIYRVSAKAPDESSEQLVKKTERIIETLEQPSEKPQQARINISNTKQ